MLVIEKLWGDVWYAHYSDNPLADYLAKLIVTILLAAFVAVVLLTVIGALYLFHKRKEAVVDKRAAAALPPSEERGEVLSACPYCGNTRSLDIRPCVRCGRDF